MSRRRDVSANSWLTFDFSICNSSAIRWVSPRSPDCSMTLPYTPNCAPWILFLYSMYTRKRRDRFFRRRTALRRKREKNGETRLTRCASPRCPSLSVLVPSPSRFALFSPSDPRGSYATSSRVSAITSDSPVDCLVTFNAELYRCYISLIVTWIYFMIAQIH